MKKCPYCAEDIQDEAILCRYCGKDIQVSPLTPQKNNTIEINNKPIFLVALFLTIITFLTIFILPIVYKLIIGRYTWEFVMLVIPPQILGEIIIEYIAALTVIFFWRLQSSKNIHPVIKWIVSIIIWILTGLIAASLLPI